MDDGHAAHNGRVMMNDVLIKYDELGRLVTRLAAIIEEFENAGDRSDLIRDAIGKPWDRRELPDKAGESESRWDYKRGRLVESLSTIHEAADGLHKSFEQFDEEAASKFESGEQPPKS
ncbi:hypothetical protein [Agrococcus baldri]|nr:hypothetical protein [Agrococcus baldri]